MKPSLAFAAGSLVVLGGCDIGDSKHTHTHPVVENHKQELQENFDQDERRIDDQGDTFFLKNIESFDTLSYDPEYRSPPPLLEFYLLKLLETDSLDTREIMLEHDITFGPYRKIGDKVGNTLIIHPFMDIGSDDQTYISKLIYIAPGGDDDVGANDVEEILIEHTWTDTPLPYNIRPEKHHLDSFLRSCLAGYAVVYPSIDDQSTQEDIVHDLPKDQKNH